MKKINALWICLILGAVGCGDSSSAATIAISSPNGTVYTNDDVDAFTSVSGLAIDESDSPIVCVDERHESPTPSDVYVKRWDGISWQRSGGLLVVRMNAVAHE